MISRSFLTGLLADDFFYIKTLLSKIRFTQDRKTPIRIRTCIQKRSCPCDVAAFRIISDYDEIIVLCVDTMMDPRVFLYRISLLAKNICNGFFGKENKSWSKECVDGIWWEIIETPRVEKMDNDVGRTSRWAKELRRRPASGRGSPWKKYRKRKRNQAHTNILAY